MTDRRYAAGVAILIALAIGRLAPTYRVFTQTYDEPEHVVCGLIWLERADYTDCQDHPPLARAAFAAGLYLKGIRVAPAVAEDRFGNAVLYARGDYVRNLTLARVGNVPFLILACITIFLWSRRWFGAAAAFWAVLLFVSLPPMLGHAGLATLDLASAATVCTALYAWVRWLEAPGWRRAIGLGAAIGVALFTKFAIVVFLPVCAAASLVALALTDRGALLQRVSSRIVQGGAAVGLALTLLWAGYGFELTPLGSRGSPRQALARISRLGPTALSLANAALDVPVPFTSVVRGLYQVHLRNSSGPGSYYLFGRNIPWGSWKFFPTAIGVKTPGGFLVLVIAGIALVLTQFRRAAWPRGLTLLFPAVILLVSMTAHINQGIRHVLPVYPFLAIMAGHAVATALRSRRLIAVGAVLLVGWTVEASVQAHPDYMAYFNRLAGDRPERILAESDLDWGQDLGRLSRRLKDLGVQDVAIAYFGTARLKEAGLPRYRLLDGTTTTTGWVAASVGCLYVEYARDGGYAWLRALTPRERVGKSIYLFYVDP